MERDRQKELEKLKREYQEMKIPVEGYQKTAPRWKREEEPGKICGNQE